MTTGSAVSRERGNAYTTGVRGPGSGARGLGEHGAALVTVLVLIVLLTVIGGAMVTAALTEVTIAFNQGDAAAAQQIADAGIARAIQELKTNPSWGGTGGPVTLGDGTYDVTVAASGTVRVITSTGVRGGGRQVLKASLMVIPRSAAATVLTNTTATIGAAAAGLTVSNTLPSGDAGAVHANNMTGAAAAITVNLAGATVIGNLTANGPIAGVTCATWPWRCDPAAGTVVLPRLDIDSAAASSFRERAKSAIDPADGKNLYFRGGDPTSRCMSGGGWSFVVGETQRCWDKYVSDRSRSIGQNITNAVFFVEFTSGERTTYTKRGASPPSFRAASFASNGGGAVSLTITLPAGVVANDVMVAAIAVSGGSATTITAPAGWTLVTNPPIDNGTTLRMAVYYKVATGAEPGSYIWTFSSSQKASGGIQAYSNVDTVVPIDAQAGQATPSGTSHSTPSITTTVPNTMLVASFSVARGTTFTPPAGMTERYDVASTGGGGGTRTTSEGTDQIQVAAGATGAKTATSGGAAALGAAHILGLRPGGPTVGCTGYPNAVETLCIRALPATASDASVEFAQSDLRQVTGAIVAFRRGTGTTVSGDIVLENPALSAAAYSHSSFAGNPAFIAGGKFQILSSGVAPTLHAVDITGIIYTFAGTDNPDGNNNLQGSTGVGVNVQHGADLVLLTLNGVVLSNGSVTLQDTAANGGTVSVLYDAAVANDLPAALTTSVDNVVLLVSWSGGD